MAYVNLCEYGRQCAKELRENKDANGNLLTYAERLWRRKILGYRAQDSENQKYKQQFENVKENYKKEKPAALQFQQHNYSKSDLKAIFADNDIFGGN